MNVFQINLKRYSNFNVFFVFTFSLLSCLLMLDGINLFSCWLDCALEFLSFIWCFVTFVFLLQVYKRLYSFLYVLLIFYHVALYGWNLCYGWKMFGRTRNIVLVELRRTDRESNDIALKSDNMFERKFRDIVDVPYVLPSLISLVFIFNAHSRSSLIAV